MEDFLSVVILVLHDHFQPSLLP